MKRVSAIIGIAMFAVALNCAAQGVTEGVATVKGSSVASDGTKSSFDTSALLSVSTNVLVAVVDTTSGSESVTLEERTPGGAFVRTVANLNQISVIAKASAKVAAEWTLTFGNEDLGEVVFEGTVKVDKTTILATSVSGKAAGPSDRGIVSLSISAKSLTPPPG